MGVNDLPEGVLEVERAYHGDKVYSIGDHVSFVDSKDNKKRAEGKLVSIFENCCQYGLVIEVSADKYRNVWLDKDDSGFIQ